MTTAGLDESSGVAASYQVPGEYFTHNDDGPILQFWRFGTTGKATLFETNQVLNRDIEDMCSVRLGGKSHLFFADIGDNALQYPSVRIYRIEEPKARSSKLGKVQVYTFTYPTGPLNAEAFFVDPGTGDFWLIEKATRRDIRVFRCQSPVPGMNQWSQMGTITMPGTLSSGWQVTGAAVSPNRDFVVLRTYFQALEFPVADSFPAWFQQTPLPVTTGFYGQSESICYDLRGSRVVMTAEGVPCQVSEVPILVP